MSEEKKPWRGFGMCPNATDGNGRVHLVTEKQCMALLRSLVGMARDNEGERE